MTKPRPVNVTILVVGWTRLSVDDVREGLPWFLRRWFERLHGGRFRVVDVIVREVE